MKPRHLALLLTAMTLVSLPALAEPAASTNSPASDQIMALKQQVDTAYAAYQTNHDDNDKLWKAYYHLNDTNLPKIFELAKQDPASETSFEAFSWIVNDNRLSIEQLRPYGT